MKSKRISKFVVLSLLALTLMGIGLFPQSAGAKETMSPKGINKSANQEIVPFADELIVCYRTINNDRYKRRWNATSGRWYDNAWVPVGEEFPGP